MEVYFVDIGIGTGNVVLLGDGRAIVIDCGKNALSLRHLLKKCCVHSLELLCISHNDDDHAGGARAILTDFEGVSNASDW